jgi:hypothetical protein
MAKRRNTGDSSASKGERKSSMSTKGIGINQAIKVNRKMDALRKGKDVVFTMSNPNKAETNKPFVKVKVSGKNYLKYGSGN